MKNVVKLLVVTILLISSISITAFAADIGPGYTGWNQLADGSWEYYVSGEKVINQSIVVDGKQYYFDTNGKFHESGDVVNTQTDTTQTTENVATQGNEITPSVYVSEEWKNRANPYDMPDVVEVDIPKQHVWCYRNNVLVWDSYCTTGCVEKGTETPRGNFTIQAKQRQRYLMGPKDPVTGEPKWKNWVEYWMPFHNGCGLHDASWRKKFAGTIYVYAGSHGCVNLPPERVPDLYDRVYVGMPCIVHD